MAKPFWLSLPISINDLPSRKSLLRDMAQTILLGGSIFVTGDLQTAKTSLLQCLMEKENRSTLFGPTEKRIKFNYLDCQTLASDITPLAFWKMALLPILKNKAVDEESLSTANDIISMLTKSIGKKRIFVLILDEFDALVTHTTPEDIKVLPAVLRAIASLTENFVVIISSHFHPIELTHRIWGDKMYGSPPFNIYTTRWVDALSEDDIKTALAYVDHPFSPREIQFIIEVSGGHPYLVDIAASVLMEQNTRDETEFVSAGEKILKLSETFFSEKWRKWNDDTRKAVTAIFLLQSPTILKDHDFIERDLISALGTLQFELRHLEYTNGIIRDRNKPGMYKLSQGAMLWWMADIIIQSIRRDSNFSEWLLEQQMPNTSRSKNAKEALAKTTEMVGRLLEKGASTLIEAYVKNLVNP